MAPAMSPEERAAFFRTWLGFAAMSGGMFMAFLDIQIVASSLNQIQAGLQATQAEMARIQTSYLIAEVIAIPLSGYLSRLMSTRIYYTVSVLGFTAASAACAMAWNIESMMAFRVLQGFLGGGMIPSSFAAIYLMFPAERRIWPQVVMGFTTPLAPMFGPVVGGWLTGVASWHWLFLINLVPGLLIALAVWRLVDFDRPDWSLWKTLDLQGVLSMAVFLGSLEWVLEEGPHKGWFESPVIGFWASVSLVAAVLFFTRVFTYAHPIIDLKLFRDRNFALANGAAMLISAPLLGANYILPLFLGSVRGFDSIQIGNTLMISGVAMFIAMPLVAKAARSLDLRLLFVVGCAILGFGVWSMGNLTVETGSGELAWPLALRAIGILFALTACSTISLSMLPTHSVKVGSAMYSLVRNMGGALGLAGINTVLAYRSAAHATALASTLDPSRAAVRDAMAANAGNTLWYAELAHRIQVQVQVLAFNDALRFLLLLVVLASPLLLLTRRAVPDPARDAHEI